MSRSTPDRAHKDEDEPLLARLILEAGDPEVAPRPEHVAAVCSRLLNHIGPPQVIRPRRTWRLVASGLAAACLLAAFAWPRPEVKNAVPGPGMSQSMPPMALRPPVAPAGDAAWLAAQRDLDGGHPLTFHWPLQETASLMVSSSIPPDLLD